MFRKVFSILCSLYFLTGCNLFAPDKEVSFAVPTPPEALESMCVGLWTLECGTLEGQCDLVELDWTEGLPESIVLARDKGREMLVLLHPPELIPGLGFHPWGAYVSVEGETVDFSADAGAAVTLLLNLAKSEASMEGFNVSRLMGEMAELDDPWNIDFDTLYRQLSRRQMRSWYIREKPRFEVGFSLEDGMWFDGAMNEVTPVIPEQEDEAEGQVEAVLMLPEGYGFFYNPVESLLAEYQVDSHGETYWIIRNL